MPYDVKKEEKEYYQPKARPQILYLPQMRFISLDVEGEEGIAEGHQRLVGAMKEIRSWDLAGSYDFVMPPLELLWRNGKDPSKLPLASRRSFSVTLALRLPSFVPAFEVGSRLEGITCLTLEELECVQFLHTGSLARLKEGVAEAGSYVKDFGLGIDTSLRRYHEIRLNDHLKTPTAKWRTVVRIPLSPS